MTLATDENQILLIYSNQSSIGKQTLAYVESNRKDNLTRSLEDSPITSTQWTQVADKLNLRLDALFDISALPKDQEAASLSTDGWLKMIENNPELLKNPILISGERIEQITNPSQAMAFIQVDSARLEKKSLGEEPVTKIQTKGETQVP